MRVTDRQTDRRTDGRTDRITTPKTALSIARAVKVGFRLTYTYCTTTPKMAALHHLGFLKIQIFNGTRDKEDHF